MKLLRTRHGVKSGRRLRRAYSPVIVVFRRRLDDCSALYLLATARSRIPRDRDLPPGKPGTPPCRSGQLKKELGLEASSVAVVARLMFAVMNRPFCRFPLSSGTKPRS